MWRNQPALEPWEQTLSQDSRIPSQPLPGRGRKEALQEEGRASKRRSAHPPSKSSGLPGRIGVGEMSVSSLRGVEVAAGLGCCALLRTVDPVLDSSQGSLSGAVEAA